MLKDKTTQVAIVGMIGFAVILGLTWKGFIDSENLGTALSSWAGAVMTIGLFYAGDRNKKNEN